MVGELLQAVLNEVKALFAGTGGTYMLKTDFKNEKLTDYAMPLVLLDLLNAPDSKVYPGGMTQMEWDYAFNSYNYEPDSFVDVGSYATTLLNFPIDAIRQHFTLGIWILPETATIFATYGFKFTMAGVTTADALNQDGLVMGYKITFFSVGFDATTQYVIPSTIPLETIIQDNPPFDGLPYSIPFVS